jgi:hypothetical protein
MWILSESKQSIVNLGIPPIIAALLFERFKKNVFVVAKWYKEFSTNLVEQDARWWRQIYHGFEKPTIVQMVDLYEATELYNSGKISIDDYNKARDKAGFADIKPGETVNQERLKEYVSEQFFSETFFDTNLARAVYQGKVKNIKTFSSLNYIEANAKYEEKTTFEDKEPIKSYPNGWKWIDAGDRCSIVGKQMKNCGSVGVMGTDPNRTMLVLFDGSNNPHVVATYSPKEKRISGIQGQASTAIKDEYADYVIDLAGVMGAEIDAMNTSSKFLALKAMFGPGVSITRIHGDKPDPYNEVFLIKTSKGDYYSNGYETFPAKDLQNIKLPKPTTNLFDKVRELMNYNNRRDIEYDNPGISKMFGRIRLVNPMDSFVSEAVRKLVKEAVNQAVRQQVLKFR